MPDPALRALLERAATDTAFRAKLLANPALAEGLSREQIKALLNDLSVLDGQLTDEMLDTAAGGASRTNLGLIGVESGSNPRDCIHTSNHNQAGLRAARR